MSSLDGISVTNTSNVCRSDTNASNFSTSTSDELQNNVFAEPVPTHDHIDLETLFDLPKRSFWSSNEVDDMAIEPYEEFGLVEETPPNFSDEWLCLAIQQMWPLDENVIGNSLRFTDDGSSYDPYSFATTAPDFFFPDWSVISPGELQMRLPITLVLDLDETLVHSTLDTCKDADFSFPVHYSMKDHTVYVRQRPHLRMFLETVACMFEIIIFTAGQSSYAERLLDILDPDHTLICHRIYRDSCVLSESGYLKDLTILGRDLARIAIVDNSPQVFQLQVENGIPIESWFGDPADNALVSLLSFLETLVGAEDVRPLIRKRFGGL